MSPYDVTGPQWVNIYVGSTKVNRNTEVIIIEVNEMCLSQLKESTQSATDYIKMYQKYQDRTKYPIRHFIIRFREGLQNFEIRYENICIALAYCWLHVNRYNDITTNIMMSPITSNPGFAQQLVHTINKGNIKDPHDWLFVSISWNHHCYHRDTHQIEKQRLEISQNIIFRLSKCLKMR